MRGEMLEREGASGVGGGEAGRRGGRSAVAGDRSRSEKRKGGGSRAEYSHAQSCHWRSYEAKRQVADDRAAEMAYFQPS